MLISVVYFAAQRPHLFPQGSKTAELIGLIQAAVRKLSEHKTSQTSGREDGKVSTAERALARAKLRDQLYSISRTARALGLGQFWVTQDKGDRALIEIGQIFATRAETYKQLFIECHMPADFIEKLNSAIGKLEKAIQVQAFTADTLATATSAIEQAHGEALAALARLDPLMENLLRDDSPTLDAWWNARRIGKAAGAKRIQPPAVTQTDVNAAQA
jgi:hypothetical protein